MCFQGPVPRPQPKPKDALNKPRADAGQQTARLQGRPGRMAGGHPAATPTSLPRLNEHSGHEQQEGIGAACVGRRIGVLPSSRVEVVFIDEKATVGK